MGTYAARVRALTREERTRLRDRIQSARGAAGRRLIAYVEPRPGEAVDSAALADFLRRDLPEYMVPSLFVAVDGFPITSSGKIDRSALPDPFASPRTARRGGPPQGPTEHGLARVWMDVLGLTDLQRDDDFFADLGGHSLLVTRLLAAIQRALAVDLSVSALFQAPTVAKLASLIDQEKAGGSEVDAPAIERVPRTRERFDAADD